jgi:DNA-binding transcriptional regulator LsrR (DeoR family)
MTLEEMKEVPYRLCVAGGSLKLAAIQAALRGGYATHLVTDQKTAETLLKAGKRAGNAVASGVRSNL